MSRAPHDAARDDRGAALVEFAILAPVFLVIVLGGLEIGHTLYVKTVLTGQLQKAARDMSLEGASASARSSAITDTVKTEVRKIIPGADVAVVARSYRDYANVASPAEEYNDADHDGRCNHGEAFVDGNRNGVWDADGSSDGRGGAKDVVLLTATVTYGRLIPNTLFVRPSTTRLSASTLLRNQPNDQQADPPTGTCP